MFTLFINEKDEKSIDRYKRAVKRKLDVDEEIIDDSDHDSENVANILLDLSTSEIPVLFFIHLLIKYLNIFKSNTKLIKHRIYLCSHYLLMFYMCMYIYLYLFQFS
jgi:hypothetical protein